ncbi:hypothetical protein TDB9533_01543 [Thalassocella blandensis]|nr:hypothetical protein TDB9533_01543 [Thalassocella blandensis]
MNELINMSLLSDWRTFSITLLLGVLVLFLARSHAHSAITGFFRLIASVLRLAAKASESTREQLKARNREVLLEQGQQHVSQELEREFYEVSRFVQRDLGGYPAIQRQIHEEITRIHDDYEKSGEVITALPEWVEAVESVAKIKSSEHAANLNNKVLEQIHKSAEQQHKEQLQLARQTAADRHKRLKGMTEYWRKLTDSVDDVGGRLKDIITRSENIDRHMKKYTDITAGTDEAVRALRASSITQFLIALIVVVIALGGAYFNFHLIALPMSEMVGSTDRIGGVKVSDLAAMVIICIEVTAGIFLLESLRITKLFPMIGSMDDKFRRIIMVCAGSVLLILASTESALAFMRDQIAGDLASLRASLSGGSIEATHSPISEWIPLAANMILGFVLPLALTMIAIPLEYLLQTGRTVCGSLMEILLSGITMVFRILSSTTRQTGKLLISLYDFVIAAPLWLEAMIMKTRHNKDQDFSATQSYSSARVKS